VLKISFVVYILLSFKTIFFAVYLNEHLAVKAFIKQVAKITPIPGKN